MSANEKILKSVYQGNVRPHFVILVCCFHVILLSKVTPRYVCCSLILSGVSSKVSLPGWILGESVKRVPVGFSLLMVAHQPGTTNHHRCYEVNTNTRYGRDYKHTTIR
jgi:hypothetical protein